MEICMRKVKIAIIGAGKYNHTSQVVESIIKQGDIFELVGYCLPENEKESYPEVDEIFKGYDELSLNEIMTNPDIEAVVIQTEEIYTSKYVKLAALNNKHVHMEKAGGVCHDEYIESVELLKKNNKIFHTGYMFRYNPCIIELINAIKNGELGEIISVEAQMNCIHANEARNWLKRLPGGMMYYLGCHLIDLILKIQGEPEKIIPFNRSSSLDNVDSIDFGMALFEYKKGISFVKTTAIELGGYARRQLVVTGTKKTVELKPLEMYYDIVEDVYTQVTEYTSEAWKDRGKTYDSPVCNRYDSMMKSFAEMVSGKKENICDYDYEIKLHKYILEACGEEK